MLRPNAASATILFVLLVICRAPAHGATYTIQNSGLAFSVSGRGGWELLDRASGEAWRSNPDKARFAVVTASRGKESVQLDASDLCLVSSSAESLILEWHPSVKDLGTLRFAVKLLPENAGLKISWNQTGGTWRIREVRFPDSSFKATKDQAGYLVVPNRLGLMVPAGEKRAETRTYPTYGSYFGLTMAMAGSVKNGSAVMLSWTDPYTSLQTRRSSDLSFVDLSLINSGSTGEVAIRPVGKGGYVEIAKAYREVARERGLLVTLKEKWPAGFPLAGKEYLSLQSVYNRDSGVGKVIESTFAQSAETAEHIKNDLGIDQGMFNLWGWGSMGYDRHPDMLPAAAECGGNEGLIDCSKRVKALGYLFGLRDNYQDMYRDAPSWDPAVIMRNRDGSLMEGGMWAGVMAYRINPKLGLQIAQRSQNLPGIKDLFHPDFLYMDTTMATPLFEDFSREHPLTFSGDIYWKQKLCSYARGLMGIFGSEEGVEWGVPCADFLESMMSARTLHYIDEVQIPLFEMVYGDCVQIYQGDRTMVNTPTFVLDHLLCAEMPMIWTWPYHAELPWCQVTSVRRTGPASIDVTCNWQTYQKSPPKSYGCVLELTDPKLTDGWASTVRVARSFSTPTNEWPTNSTVTDGPIHISSPELAVSSSGDRCYDVYTYMSANPDGTGDRVRIRGPIVCLANGILYGYVKSVVARLKLSPDGSVTATWPVLPDLYSFARCDTRRDIAYQDDALRLNTYRICSPLNRLTANTPMTNHVFLTADRSVQRSEFGDVTITVNYGSTTYDTGNALLPQYGFLVESPQLIAFRAISYAGKTFSEPTMAVISATDGKPIATSVALDTYRAYGDTQVKVAGREILLK